MMFVGFTRGGRANKKF